nr:hypothetical protein [Tanacetum cinerariifolium]
MYKNFSAPSIESLDSIFNRLQNFVSQLAILVENISQEDLNLNFLRSLSFEWNTHVLVWRNKPDLDTMRFDDLYNNFKIVEQEDKGTASSSSSLCSQLMAFVSSPSSTNEVNTAYGVSTASTQISTASTQVSTANLSDATVYAFLSSQPNGSQLVHEDLVQIHEDDLEEMDLKRQLGLLSTRTKKFFQKIGRKININGSDTVGYDKSKVECFNCHKLGPFTRECRQPRNQDNRNKNQDCFRRTVNVEETSSKAMVAIDGAGFNWSYMEDDEVPTNMALMAFSGSKVNNDGTCSKTCLKSFETHKTQLDDLRIEFNEFGVNLATYKRWLASVEEQLVFYKKMRNKPDLDTMSFDDLYNNFKIVKQEDKGTVSSSSSLCSQLMAFVSSPSNTNEVNTAYGVSTASTQISIASTQVSTANLSDATVYAFLSSQPNGIVEHEDQKVFPKIGRKININGSDTVGYDKSKVECFNCHKLGPFTRECRQPRNQDSRNKNQDSFRRTVNVEETSSKAMVAIDGAGFNWSYMEDDEVPTNMALMAFSDSKHEFEGYGPKTNKSVSEDISNKVKKSPDTSLVKELVLDDKLEKKTIFHTVAKIEFVRPKQQEKPVKCAEKYRNMAPRAVLIKTGLRPLNTTRPTAVNTARPNSAVVNAVRANQGHPQKEDQGYVDSGCSWNMTGNISYLSDFKEFNGRYVTFGGGTKGGKIIGK